MTEHQATSPQGKILGVILLAYALACLALTIWLADYQQRPGQITEPGDYPASPMLLHRQAPDFAAFSNTQVKKQRFFEFLLPAIQEQNAGLLNQRHWLEQQQQARNIDQQTLLLLARRYRIHNPEKLQSRELIDKLLLHVDMIPAALVLAQAANESAWGTSRFARQANNYFGQWCFTKGCGVVPQQRSDGATHEVARFKSADASVAGYFVNINRNQSYQTLREIRAQMRQYRQPLDAVQLAEGLQHYSSRGQEYITELQAMIRYNNLEQYPDLAP